MIMWTVCQLKLIKQKLQAQIQNFSVIVTIFLSGKVVNRYSDSNHD